MKGKIAENIWSDYAGNVKIKDPDGKIHTFGWKEADTIGFEIKQKAFDARISNWIPVRSRFFVVLIFLVLLGFIYTIPFFAVYGGDPKYLAAKDAAFALSSIALTVLAVGLQNHFPRSSGFLVIVGMVLTVLVWTDLALDEKDTRAHLKEVEDLAQYCDTKDLSVIREALKRGKLPVCERPFLDEHLLTPQP